MQPPGPDPSLWQRSQLPHDDTPATPGQDPLSRDLGALSLLSSPWPIARTGSQPTILPSPQPESPLSQLVRRRQEPFARTPGTSAGALAVEPFRRPATRRSISPSDTVGSPPWNSTDASPARSSSRFLAQSPGSSGAGSPLGPATIPPDSPLAERLAGSVGVGSPLRPATIPPDSPLAERLAGSVGVGSPLGPATRRRNPPEGIVPLPRNLHTAPSPLPGCAAVWVTVYEVRTLRPIAESDRPSRRNCSIMFQHDARLDNFTEYCCIASPNRRNQRHIKFFSTGGMPNPMFNAPGLLTMEFVTWIPPQEAALLDGMMTTLRQHVDRRWSHLTWIGIYLKMLVDRGCMEERQMMNVIAVVQRALYSPYTERLPNVRRCFPGVE